MGLYRLAHNRQLPLLHDDHAQNALDQGGLSRTIGPEHGPYPTPVDGKVQGLEHLVPSEFFMYLGYLYHFVLFIKGLLSIRLSGVKTGETFSEKSIMSINRLLRSTMVTGERLTI